MPGGGYIFITAVRNCKAASDQRETPTKPPPPHYPSPAPLGMSSFYAEFLFADSRCPFCDEFLIRRMFNCGRSRSVGGGGGGGAIRARARRFCRGRPGLPSSAPIKLARQHCRSLSAAGVNWKSDYIGDKAQRLSEEMSLRIVRVPNQNTAQIKKSLSK